MTDTLGVLYGTVVLAPYTSDWARAFDEEATRLRPALRPWACRVEHIGSTAISGLTAKPIIDIAIGVPDPAEVRSVIAPLETLAYTYRGNAGADGGHVLVRESAPRVRTHHIHVVSLQDPQWTNYLALREFLRANPDARDTYGRTKAALATRYADDRRAYTRAKASIIRRLLLDAGGRHPAIPSPAP